MRTLHQNRQAYARAYFSAALTNIEQQIKAHRRGAATPASRTSRFVPTLLKKAEMQVMLGRLYPGHFNARRRSQDSTGQHDRPAQSRRGRGLNSNESRPPKPITRHWATSCRSKRYLVDYHLADVAAAENNAPEEIRCLKRYLRRRPRRNSEYAPRKKGSKRWKATNPNNRMRVTHVITRLIIGGAQENTVATVLGLQNKPGIEVNLLPGRPPGRKARWNPPSRPMPDS